MFPMRPLTNSKALALYQAELSPLVGYENCVGEFAKLPECSTACPTSLSEREMIYKPESEGTKSENRRESL